MGAYLDFFGFNRAPDLATLNNIPWLTDWRLFHEPAASAWYLEGQSNESVPTFFEEVKWNPPPLPEALNTLFDQIKADIKRYKGDATQFDTHALHLAALLSKTLAQPIASFLGNDEGLDSCFVFDQGQLQSGGLEIAWDKELIVSADGTRQLRRIYAEGTSENDPGFTPRYEHHIATEGARAFFG
ncbi:MAG: hypothetical protein AAFX02_10530, partial [Pseudomonadota bacterium]